MEKLLLKSIKWYSVNIIESMGKPSVNLCSQLDCREIPIREEDIDYYEDDEFIKRKSNCTIFLGFTSNIVSSGVRETIKFLVQHKMVMLLLKEKSDSTTHVCSFSG